MDPLLKDFIIQTRKAIPDWAIDSDISVVFRLEASQKVSVNIVGIPPMDKTTIRYDDRHGEVIRNWGAVEVDSLLDTPERIEARREVLKDYDNNLGRPKKKDN